IPLAALGNPVPASGLCAAPVPTPRRRGETVEADVFWVDHFGNVQLSVTPAHVADFGPRVTVVVQGRALTARRVRAFAELAPGELGLVTDSYGQLALVYDRAPAAVRLGLAAGEEVSLRP
ncbi:MAG: SAM-dependent chlorinase/fluorinase, partial [Acidimicrobiaceae bacterium]|nr:SAM-dependent chlorinase/fluorinase [Acidimicrobiaceae bacterium]